MFTDASRLLDLLKRYFHIFGDKAACYEDVRLYTDLDSDSSSDWIAFLEGMTPSPVSFSNFSLVEHLSPPSPPVLPFGDP